jgi:hypothetical protein
MSIGVRPVVTLDSRSGNRWVEHTVTDITIDDFVGDVYQINATIVVSATYIRSILKF